MTRESPGEPLWTPFFRNADLEVYTEIQKTKKNA